MIGVLAAPSNLGLRPPEPGSVPGTAKAPEALRDAGLHRQLLAAGAVENGAVLPGRYRDDPEPVPGRLRNQEALVDHARRLADRLGGMLDQQLAPLVLGGDCSLLVGVGVALKRRGRYGLVHLDGHTDFRHPGNSPECLSLAGEALPAAIGRHWPVVTDIDGLAPYFNPADVVHAGCRPEEEDLAETREVLADVIPAEDIRSGGVAATLDRVRSVLQAEHLEGYWLHLDVDILDPTVMPAVDSPDPGGLDPGQLTALLRGLTPSAVGAQVTIFDPDLDPDGRGAAVLVDILVDGLGMLGTQIGTST